MPPPCHSLAFLEDDTARAVGHDHRVNRRRRLRRLEAAGGVSHSAGRKSQTRPPLLEKAPQVKIADQLQAAQES